MYKNLEKKWKVDYIPNLNEKVVIITGGNTGLGFQSSLELAKKNATVIIACRDTLKGIKAIQELNKLAKRELKLDTIKLDLADFKSIRNFVSEFKSKYNRLDILMNNAGVVNQIEKGNTNEGFETHIGTNHLGHFTLTGQLIDYLSKTENSRVVNLSSMGYKSANLNFNDINWENRPYHRVKSYADSKLANLLFTLKLQQYFDKNNINCTAVSAHPGLSASPRQQSIGIGGKLFKFLATPLSRGSRPQLAAATIPYLSGLEFFGPKYGLDGPPISIKIKHKQYNQEYADKLWCLSEKLTKTLYPLNIID